jgi:hypothetical protein
MIATAENIDDERPRPAPETMIRSAIRQVYDEAEANQQKPPNINELPAAVITILTAKGYAASGRQIKAIGDDIEFQKRRGATGKRLH